MGYTHYWDNVAPLYDNYRAAVEDCAQIVQASPVPLADGFGEAGTKPELSIPEGVVRFNGLGPDMYETFDVTPGEGSGFCKTEHRPYDVVVVACLARLAEAGLAVRSDGNRKGWTEGLALASTVLGRDIPCPEGIRE